MWFNESTMKLFLGMVPPPKGVDFNTYYWTINFMQQSDFTDEMNFQI